MTNLHKLSLTRNLFIDFPEKICDIYSLKYLSLNNNKIITILKNNKISKLPKELPH